MGEAFMLASWRDFSVPPVERISTPLFDKNRAKSTRPFLSDTDINARCILIISISSYSWAAENRYSNLPVSGTLQ
jgi:hypothetical protein